MRLIGLPHAQSREIISWVQGGLKTACITRMQPINLARPRALGKKIKLERGTVPFWLFEGFHVAGASIFGPKTAFYISTTPTAIAPCMCALLLPSSQTAQDSCSYSKHRKGRLLHVCSMPQATLLPYVDPANLRHAA